ncbi:hypothetical protein [Pseudomonas sp. Pseusp16]|uniref:hypothetical protein n=1 Tax=Pseudomonas sp. Pseusp16 TaxID=3243021 RepID=UPI0039B43345
MGGSNFGHGKEKSLYKHSGRYRATLKNIVSKALGHSSFLLMCAGSGALFLSNLLTKRYLSPQDYLFLSYFITITTILSSFALGGMEQLIIRYCKHTNNTIEIDKTSLISIIAAMIISLIASPLITTTLLPSSLAAPWILLLTLSFSLTLINYNVARVRSGFVEAQISSGMWKIAAFLGVFVCCIKLSDNLQTALLVGMVVAGALNIYLIKKNISSLVVVKGRSSTISTGLAFSFSLAIMTVLGTFDRVLAEKLSGQTLFAEYVYFSMILIFPFNMIASYVGFREAIFFKNKFSADLIKRKAWSLFVKITILFVIFGGCVYFLSPLINLKTTWQNMTLSYFLVCTKCIYSIFSSVMGSRATAKEIWTSNIYSAVAIIAITAIFIMLDNDITINSLLMLFIVLWASRTIIFTNMVLSKQHD